MRIIIFIFMFICAWDYSQAQVNFVRNPDFEKYDTCPPDHYDQIKYANYWSAVDSNALLTPTKGACVPEYCNACIAPGPGVSLGVPYGIYYQYPRSGNGMALGEYFCDELPPPSAPGYAYRDYLQGRLYATLVAGKNYCVTFYINLVETTTYATNKMGAYLDDGSIDTVSICSKPITFVRPQVYTNDVIDDTLNWVKVEGSFTANGTERFITLGNFFPNDSITYTIPLGIIAHQWAFYLLDDVSVIESDLAADAGADRWVELSKTVEIGRVGDSTAIGLDCKWYHKGSLIDSGAIINVVAGAVIGAIDTYVVVQSICGLQKTDTVLVSTVGLGGLPQLTATKLNYAIYPNPSKGAFVIEQKGAISTKPMLKVYDLLGKVIYEKQIEFTDQKASIKLNASIGMYIIELTDENNNRLRDRIVIE